MAGASSLQEAVQVLVSDRTGGSCRACFFAVGFDLEDWIEGVKVGEHRADGALKLTGSSGDCPFVESQGMTSSVR